MAGVTLRGDDCDDTGSGVVARDIVKSDSVGRFVDQFASGDAGSGLDECGVEVTARRAVSRSMGAPEPLEAGTWAVSVPSVVGSSSSMA